ncbi:hypothetical protein AI20_04805 [Aeromonas hydrophila YL17]|nr:hypothetical protein AI20_04805 [Aeromonas hydrophila YL17]
MDYFSLLPSTLLCFFSSFFTFYFFILLSEIRLKLLDSFMCFLDFFSRIFPVSQIRECRLF